MSMLEEFKKFALRGNVLDLAIGVIIGGAFGTIVTSLVQDIMMPPIGVRVERQPRAGLSGLGPAAQRRRRRAVQSWHNRPNGPKSTRSPRSTMASSSTTC